MTTGLAKTINRLSTKQRLKALKTNKTIHDIINKPNIREI